MENSSVVGGPVFLFLFFMAGWGLPMWINGSIALRRRHSVVLWVLMALVFSWFSVLFAALMQDRRAIEEELKDLREWRRERRQRGTQ